VLKTVPDRDGKSLDLKVLTIATPTTLFSEYKNKKKGETAERITL
jgi:hypothetical protein